MVYISVGRIKSKIFSYEFEPSRDTEHNFEDYKCRKKYILLNVFVLGHKKIFLQFDFFLSMCQEILFEKRMELTCRKLNLHVQHSEWKYLNDTVQVYLNIKVYKDFFYFTWFNFFDTSRAWYTEYIKHFSKHFWTNPLSTTI